MNVPQELKYDKEQHIWVLIDDNTATIGITDFAQEKMGDILFVELADADDEFERGDEFSVVESGKKASPLEAPFSFKVLEANEDLDDEPEAINEDAYANWILKVQITDDEGIEDLIDAAVYEAAIAE
ncbi:MAG: glycine cleavage system H protein [Eubacterium sp.]